MDIIKSTKDVTSTVVTSPAHYKDLETGNFNMVTVIKENGQEVKEKRAITQRHIFPPATKEVTKKVDMWNITVGKEVHEFASAEDARRFRKDSRG